MCQSNPFLDTFNCLQANICEACIGDGVITPKRLRDIRERHRKGERWPRVCVTDFAVNQMCPSCYGEGFVADQDKYQELILSIRMDSPHGFVCNECWGAACRFATAANGYDPDRQSKWYRVLTERHNCPKSPTVRETAKKRRGHDATRDYYDQYHQISRAWFRFENDHEEDAFIVKLYTGGLGETAVGAGYERIWSLMPITPSGQRIMGRTWERRELLDVFQRIESASVSKKTVDRILFKAAGFEAQRILEASARVWETFCDQHVDYSRLRLPVNIA